MNQILRFTIETRCASGTYSARVERQPGKRATSTAGGRHAAIAWLAKHAGVTLAYDSTALVSSGQVSGQSPQLHTYHPASDALEMEVVNTVNTVNTVSSTSEIALINHLHQQAQTTAAQAKSLAERACHYAVLVGLRLQAIQHETPHGQWKSLFDDSGKNEPWFVFGIRTAQKYIAAARGALNRPGLPAAARKRIMEFAASEGAADPDETLTADLARATAGQTLRQLYLDLGIIRADATETGAGNRNGPPPPPPPPVDESQDYLEGIIEGLVKADRWIKDPLVLGCMRKEHLSIIDNLLMSFRDCLKPYLRA